MHPMSRARRVMILLRTASVGCMPRIVYPRNNNNNKCTTTMLLLITITTMRPTTIMVGTTQQLHPQ